MVDAVETSVAVATDTPASRSSDTPVIVDAVQKHLDAFNGLIETPETPKVEAAPVEETPKAEVAEGGTPAATPAVKKQPDAEPVVEAVAAPAVPTLPAAYIRTAKARGWSDEEIAQFSQASPDLAIRTLGQMHESRTKEIQEWAELGRKVRQGQVAAPVAPSPSPSPAAVVPASTALQPLNVRELKERFGNEELIDALAGPVNAAIAALGPITQRAQETEQNTQRTNRETVGKLISDFFTAKEMAPFTETYGGADFSKLTPVQIETRSRVLETADALIAGARYQGRNLSVNEALTLAHDSVSSGTKETIIRESIRKTAAKREKGITLKPTAQGRINAGAPPRDRAELHARTEDRLRAAFG